MSEIPIKKPNVSLAEFATDSAVEKEAPSIGERQNGWGEGQIYTRQKANWQANLWGAGVRFSVENSVRTFDGYWGAIKNTEEGDRFRLLDLPPGIWQSPMEPYWVLPGGSPLAFMDSDYIFRLVDDGGITKLTIDGDIIAQFDPPQMPSGIMPLGEALIAMGHARTSPSHPSASILRRSNGVVHAQTTGFGGSGNTFLRSVCNKTNRLLFSDTNDTYYIYDEDLNQVQFNSGVGTETKAASLDDDLAFFVWNQNTNNVDCYRVSDNAFIWSNSFDASMEVIPQGIKCVGERVFVWGQGEESAHPKYSTPHNGNSPPIHDGPFQVSCYGRSSGVLQWQATIPSSVGARGLFADYQNVYVYDDTALCVLCALTGGFLQRLRIRDDPQTVDFVPLFCNASESWVMDAQGNECSIHRATFKKPVVYLRESIGAIREC